MIVTPPFPVGSVLNEKTWMLAVMGNYQSSCLCSGFGCSRKQSPSRGQAFFVCLFVCLFGNPPASPITEDIPSFSILRDIPAFYYSFHRSEFDQRSKTAKGRHRVSMYSRGAFSGSTVVNNQPAQRRRLNPWVKKIPWRREQLPPPAFLPGYPTDRGPRQATVPGVGKSLTWMSMLSHICTHSSLQESYDCRRWLSSLLSWIWRWP